jgi:hypothetical protein
VDGSPWDPAIRAPAPVVARLGRRVANDELDGSHPTDLSSGAVEQVRHRALDPFTNAGDDRPLAR